MVWLDAPLDDPRDATIPEAGTLAYLLHGQLRHALAAVVLLAVAFALAAPVLGDSSFLGASDRAWFTACVGLAVVHQVVVVFGFRGQLGWAWFTRWFGRRDMGAWGLVFFPLLFARPLTLLALAVADAGSLAMDPRLSTLIGLGLLVPSAYTLWSVKRYFGFARALGGDHFRVAYRELPMVTEGAFGWSSNAMYTYAFLGLWAFAFLAGSHAAVIAAMFQHGYIWVHWFCTEKPDMELIYR